MKVGTILICTSEHMGVKVGDTGVLNKASDYEPGWDAGWYSVTPDTFPDASPYGHLAVNYWTESEMLESWKVA